MSVSSRSSQPDYTINPGHTFAKCLKINQILLSFLIILLLKVQFLYIMDACIKFVGKSLLASVLFLCVLLSASGQQRVSLFSTASEPLPEKVTKDLRQGLRVKINEQEIRNIWETEPDRFQLTLPLPNGAQKLLVFNKKSIVTSDFFVETSDGKKLKGKEYTGVHYQIDPASGAEKIGTLSFTKTKLVGLVSDEAGNWNIGLLPNGKGDYVIYNDADLRVQNSFHCETEDGNEPINSTKSGGDKSVQTSGTCRTVKIYFECDFKMYTDNGSNTATVSNNVTGMFNSINQLYLNEQVNIEISQIFVWTSADPFAALTSSNLYLLNFATTRTSFNGTIAHFLTTRATSFGGLAYVNVLCNTAARYAFSNIYNTYSPLPTYSWTIGCVAHEIGHNFSSKHTHWCGWQLTASTIGRVDSCYAGESVSGAVNCTSSTKPNANGTIMSYCHMNGAINFNRGFGPLPGNALRNAFAAATCVTGNPVPVFSVNGTRATCVGGTVNLTSSTSVTGASFTWTGPNGYSSTTQNPVLTGVAAAASGNYACSVTKSGCTSDPKNVNVVVNQPVIAPLTEGFEGSFPASGWRIANPNADRTWIAHSGQGGFGTTSKCIKFDNFTYPSPANRRDSLFMPAVDLSGHTGASLSFDLAYAWNGFYNDTLVVLVSSNCGRTFSRLYAKTRTALATAPNASGMFVPTATQWRKETINLSAYNGMAGVQIAFLNVSGWSNVVYLDNINITATSSGGGPSISLAALTQSAFCPGASVSVGFTPVGTFNTGNSYVVQLSNASGSFSSPVVIGSGTTSPIVATIPTGTSSGTGYLLRVVSSAPVVNSPSSSSISVSPLVVSAGSDGTACTNGSTVSLSGTPAGGTWSGPGVSGGIFTPTTALAGAQTLTYSYSAGGCSSTDQRIITVNTPPVINAGANQATCASSAAFTLTGFTPTGGTWSGAGVTSGGVFTPSAALIGNQILTYTVTANGCTASATRQINVASTITVSAGGNQTVCSNGSAINLNGTPAGGTWSGSGVNASGLFTPSSSLIGTQTLTYTVTGTCGGSSQASVLVNGAPNAVAGIDQSFCASDAPYTITQGAPSGGSWSGNGVSGGVFTPSSSLLGSQTLTYTVTSNGCSSTDQVDFTVNSVPVPNVGANRQACAGSGPVTLSATPAGGTWSGPGITAQGIFSPSSSIIGSNTLTYNVLQNGCSGTASLIFEVVPQPVVSAGADQTGNTASDDIILAGSPLGGVWSGTGVSAAGVFSPASSGPGTFTLTYTFTSNGCSASDEAMVTITAAATVSAGSDISVCESAASVSLTGTPAGGTWTGNGVTATGVFTPGASLVGNQTLVYTVDGVGSDAVVVSVTPSPVVNAGSDLAVCTNAANFTLSGAVPTGGTWSGSAVNSAGLVNVSQISGTAVCNYTVTQNGCQASSSIVITAVSPPVVNAGSNQNLCKNAAPVQLVGTPAGGTWSGSGVTSSGLFDPSTVSSGAKTLTYSVVGSVAGCSGSDQVVISVFNIPTVNAGADRSTCVNAVPFQLSGTPAGGSWVGVGVSSSGMFTPTASLAGVQTVTYSVTQNGCTNTSTTNITVNTIPVVSAGSSQSICTNSNSFTLNGASPAGGTWSGASFVNGGGQCAAPFTAGSFNLTYTVVQNGCSGSDQIALTVNTIPVVEAGTNRSVCANGSVLNLTGFSPAGGTWSGNGVNTVGLFTPAAGLTGNQTLTYTVVQNGCSASDNMVVTVKAIPNIVTGGNETACESGVSFKLNGYSPRGGKWTGPGVFQDSLYQPSGSLIGSQVLTYTVTRNGCTNSAQKTINVTPGNQISTGSYPTSVCANGLPVSFTGFLPNGGTWKGSGMAQNGLLNPSTANPGPQTYTYKLNLNGCRDSVKVITEIKSLPVVSAGADIAVCASGSPVPLTNGTPAGGTWSGNGVNDSGIFNPAAVSAGSIPLTYAYTINGCTATDQLMANVQSSPTVSAGNDKNICKNSVPVTFTGSPFGGSWSGPGVSTNGVFVPTSSMSGNITLTYAIDQNGCSGTDQVIVSITTPVSVTAGTNEAVCDNQNALTLTGFSPSGGTWSGTGVSSGGVFTPSSSILGTQIVTYRVTKNSCTVEASKQITVSAAPQVNAGADESVCTNGLPVQLANFSPAGGSWSGTGVSPTGVFTPGSAGLVTISYTATANGCSASSNKIVTVVQAPAVDAGSDQVVCGGTAPVSMSGFFPSGGQWSGSNISASGVYTPVGGMATDSVTYSVTQNGCTSQNTKVIQVLNVPQSVALSVTGSANTCAGQVLPISFSLANLAQYAVQWKRNGTIIAGANAASFNAIQSGTYLAELNIATCSLQTDPVTLTFNPIPGAPTISQNVNVLTSSAATGNQWRRNGENILGATGQTYTITQSGIYSVIRRVNGCDSDPSPGLPVAFTSSQELESALFEIRVYPNPNEGRFMLEISGLQQPAVEVAMVDALGRRVWNAAYLANEDLAVQQEVELPKLPAGMYWLSIAGNSKTTLKRIVIR